MHGCGNDFLVLANPGFAYEDWPPLARALCDRHFGVGSDGMMIVVDASSPQKSVKVWMFNPDGSPMGMCGNGIRCLTRFLALDGIMTKESFTARFDVIGREVICDASDYGRNVKVDMGIPSFSPKDVPVDSPEPVISSPITACGKTFRCTVVSMGNPHCVIPVQSLDEIDLNELGPALENHPLFPERTNVEFVSVAAPDHISVKVWERGAGATLACGTGACAALVACTVLGLSDGRAQVDLPGGTLSVGWRGERKPVIMTGPAREVYTGVIRTPLVED